MIRSLIFCFCQKEETLPPFFTSRIRRSDGQRVYRCSLCDNSKSLSFWKHSVGIRNIKKVCQHDQEMARQQEQRIETDSEIENVEQEDDVSTRGNKDTYNVQDNLDAIGATARSPNPNFLRIINLEDVITMEDLITAELEEIL